jgi:UDP-N-acetylmuramate: L-alanyl-gamma-D-glutamyl-meso-diaminopimelate ligase
MGSRQCLQAEEEYVKQFDLFADETPKGGTLIYCEQDSLALIIGKKNAQMFRLSLTKAIPIHRTTTGSSFLANGKNRYPVKIFGSHNFQNVSAAKEVLKKVGITTERFFEAMTTFEGADGRLEKVKENNSTYHL